MPSSSAFLTPARTLARESGVKRGGSALTRLVAGEMVVLSRALCHFETVPAPAGARGVRAEQAVRLAARARAPFASPDFAFAWGAETVGVWSWDRSAFERLLNDDVRFVPETLLHPAAEGPVLRRCLDGVEGQVWRDGRLTASRWWREEPAPSEWAAFLRAARAGWEGPPPAAETPRLNRQAPAQPSAFSIERLKSLRARDIAALALALAAAPLIYLGAQYASLSLQKAQLNAQVRTLQGETADVEAARRRAAAAASDLALYDRVVGGVHPAALLAAMAEHVAAAGAELGAFDVGDGRLEATFTAAPEAGFQPAVIVQALENDPLFAGVAIEPGRRSGEWVVTGGVEGAVNTAEALG